MSKCSRCIHFCLDGRCSIFGSFKEDCSDFKPRDFDLFEHRCSYCKHLQSCPLGRAINEGDLDQHVRQLLRITDDVEIRIVIPVCKSFKNKNK